MEDQITKILTKNLIFLEICLLLHISVFEGQIKLPATVR